MVKKNRNVWIDPDKVKRVEEILKRKAKEAGIPAPIFSEWVRMQVDKLIEENESN
jgi:hypothetical protein